MVEIRTDSEIKRDERHKKICDWWKENYDPERGTRNRFLTAATKVFGLSAMGIKKVLINNNLYPDE